jgi:hypothetical protein
MNCGTGPPVICGRDDSSRGGAARPGLAGGAAPLEAGVIQAAAVMVLRRVAQARSASTAAVAASRAAPTAIKAIC